MEVKKSIFRAYDIRGVYPTDLDEEIAKHIGKAFGTHLLSKKLNNVVLGRDNRLSSPTLSTHFIEGLATSGCNITDIGITATPVIHYLTCAAGFDAGVNITASHNTSEFNGFRLDYGKAQPFYGEDVKQLYEIINSETYTEGEGQIKRENGNQAYITYILSQFNFTKRHKVVIGCGHSTTALIAPEIFEKLNCEVILTECELDSSFPEGVPNPENPRFMETISEKVLETNAEVGFGFDTDGDRFGVVDSEGKHYSTDKILMLVAQILLENKPGATVLYDVKSSELLKKVIGSYNGVPKMIRTGHPYFTEQVKAGALLGAEYSGHMYFGGQYYGYDDGMFSALKVLEILDKSEYTLAELMTAFPKTYHTQEITLECPDDLKFHAVDTISEMVESAPDVKSISRIDGLRVRVSSIGWYLVRASNTSPKITIRFEAETLDEAREIQNNLMNILSRLDILNLDPLKGAKIVYS